MIKVTFSGFMSEMEKLAGRGKGSGRGRPVGSRDTKPRKKKYILKPWQERGVKKIMSTEGKAIIAHAAGSGKTLTSIDAFEKMRAKGRAKRALVVTPAGLKSNYINQGVKKFTTSSATEYDSLKSLYKKKPSDYNVVSYALFRRHPEKFVKLLKPDTLISDEPQKAKDWKSVNYRSLMQVRPHFKHAILTTASPVSNKPSELLPLLDIVSGVKTPRPKGGLFKKTVKHDPGFKGFFGFFKRPAKYRVKEGSPYTKKIRKYVDLVTVEDIGNEGMPEKMVETVPVEMNDHQQRLFNFVMGELGWWTRFKVRHDLPMGKKEAKHVFQRIQQARAVSNGIHTLDKNISVKESAKRTPKIASLMKDVKSHLKTTKDAQIVIYSNLIHGGVDVVRAGLDQAKIPYGLFIGKANPGVSAKTRQRDVNDFNKGVLKVIVLSGAGAEGLSFNNATFHASVDGHFNPEMIKQPEARSIRYGGLAHRPKEKRKVIVKRYMSVFPQTVFNKWFGEHMDKGMDEKVYAKAAMKEKINKIFREVMRDPRTKIRKSVNAKSSF